MKIVQIFAKNSLRNFNYLIYSDSPASTGEVICIDPFDAGLMKSHLEKLNLKLTKVINTHGHHDHYAGNDELKRMTGAQIFSSEKASKKFPIDGILHEQEKIWLDDHSYLSVFLTPGHTDCHLCLVGYENNVPVSLISGDTLFNAGVGHCRDGNVHELYHTVEEFIQNLPDDVKVYPGHEYWSNNLKFTLSQDKENMTAKKLLSEYNGEYFLVSDLKLERKINLFLKADSEKEFIRLRSLRDHW